jgi:hypothetical protein
MNCRPSCRRATSGSRPRAELLHRLAPQRYPLPAGEAKAGQIRGIAVVAG